MVDSRDIPTWRWYPENPEYAGRKDDPTDEQKERDDARKEWEMDGKIDKVREALGRLSGFTYHAADSQDADDIKTVCAALSAIDPEAIRRECLESIRSHFRSMTQADIVKWDGPGVLGGAMSKELFNKTLEYAILSAEPAQDDGKPDGVELIRRERERQKTVEGWTPEHDDQHARGELASAAVCYAMIPDPESAAGVEVPADWPESWSESWWKPSPDDRVRELSKAGALIAAEIDRLMRAAEVKRKIEEAKE